MSTLIQSCALAFRCWCLHAQGLHLGRPVRLGRNLRVRRGWRDGHPGRLTAGPSLWLEDGVVLDAWGGTIALGPDVFIGPGAVIYGHGGVSIGDHTLISMHCRILSSNHTIAPFGTDIRSQPDILLPTNIGRDVWLGAGVTVLGGVTIGDGCIVGAGAVVTKDLPPGSISHGIPAKISDWRDGASR